MRVPSITLSERRDSNSFWVILNWIELTWLWILLNWDFVSSDSVKFLEILLKDSFRSSILDLREDRSSEISEGSEEVLSLVSFSWL